MFFWLLNSCAIKKEKQAGKAKYALEFLSCSVPSLRLYFSVCFFLKVALTQQQDRQLRDISSLVSITHD